MSLRDLRGERRFEDISYEEDDNFYLRGKNKWNYIGKNG
jgi:hypothetical protein